MQLPRLIWASFALSVALLALTPAPTQAKDWSDPNVRAKELRHDKCKTTLKRRLTFVKYWGPTAMTMANPTMYDEDHLGFWGWLQLGDLYYFGCPKANLAPNKQQAAVWYQAAAVAHIAEAQYKLGRMLVLGDGITEDVQHGITWLQSAAREGFGQAAVGLQALGVEPPTPISPNSYAVAVANAKAHVRQERAEYWRGVMSDLGALSVTVATAYVASQGNYVPPPAPRYAPPPQPAALNSPPTVGAGYGGIPAIPAINSLPPIGSNPYRTPPTPAPRAFSQPSTPTVAADPGCINDVQCGVGKKCLIGPYQVRGYCAVVVNEYGTRTYDNSGAAQTCRYDTDCSIGFRCGRQRSSDLTGFCLKR